MSKEDIDKRAEEERLDLIEYANSSMAKEVSEHLAECPICRKLCDIVNVEVDKHIAEFRKIMDLK